MDIWHLNIRHLRAASEILRRGSVSAAAQAVSLTQPAVTQGIARLERELGRVLFERRTDGMAPTAAARLLGPRIDAALGHVGSPRVTMAQVRAFIAVGRAGSLAEAAKISGLTEPSLHRSIKDLSLALRRTLVERRGRGIALTESGRRTLRAFRLARAELMAGLAELAALDGAGDGSGNVGRIAVGAMPLARARLLPRAVSAFHRAHPEVAVVIAEGSHAELIDPLRDGDLDLLIGALRPTLSLQDVEQAPLFADRPVVIGRAGHTLCGRADAQARLAEFPWVVAPVGTPLRTQWEAMFRALGVPPPRVPIECGSVITIRELLRGGDFLTLLSPDQLSVELAAGIVAEVCAAPGELRRVIGITTRAGWRPTESQARFLSILRDTAAGIGEAISENL